MRIDRRNALKAMGASPLARLMAGLPAGWTGAAYASDAPEHPGMRFGIIALTDNASIVMAHELGYFKKFGINSVISKEASWAVIRDKLSLGENHATHMLIGMPFASTMGLLGSPVKPMIVPWLINRNGQGAALDLPQQCNDPQTLRVSTLEVVQQVLQGQPGIDDILDDQHVPAFNRDAEVLQDLDNAG